MKSLLGFSWRRACGSVDQTVENGRPTNPGFPNRGSSGALRLCGLSSATRISDATVAVAVLSLSFLTARCCRTAAQFSFASTFYFVLLRNAFRYLVVLKTH